MSNAMTGPLSSLIAERGWLTERDWALCQQCSEILATRHPSVAVLCLLYYLQPNLIRIKILASLRGGVFCLNVTSEYCMPGTLRGQKDWIPRLKLQMAVSYGMGARNKSFERAASALGH